MGAQYQVPADPADELSANPKVEPDTICSGESAQLFAQAGGGTGNYTYAWTSEPCGFTSSDANPIVVGTKANTVFTVEIFDGLNIVRGSSGLAVNLIPLIHLGTDTTVCVFDRLILDAGNPGASYLWSNGSTERTVCIGSSGIGYMSSTISVTVTSTEGCFLTDQRTIYFDFAACTGIDDYETDNRILIYPNPGNGIIHIDHNAGIGSCLLNITDIYGREVIKNQEIFFTSEEKTYILKMGSHPPGFYLVNISEKGTCLASMKYLLK